MISVTCFTNCDTVELFLNGKSCGVKGFAFPRPGMTETYGHYPPRARALQTTGDLHLSWDVLYEPGVLMAKGTKDEQVVQVAEIHTAGPAAKLELTVDRAKIRTGRDDVAHVTVRVLDAEGRMAPTANNQIRFKLVGEGRIIGVDNGRPDSHEPYKANTRAAFNGMALVLLQSNGQPGAMTLPQRRIRLHWLRWRLRQAEMRGLPHSTDAPSPRFNPSTTACVPVLYVEPHEDDADMRLDGSFLDVEFARPISRLLLPAKMS